MRLRRWAGFRSVLCPIDFSEHSRLALRYAEKVASHGHAALHVVYANDPLLIAAAAAALHDRQVAKRSAIELGALIDSTLPARTRRQLRVTSHVSIGHPSDQIMKAAARHGSDLIVLGTHGLTGADKLIMGSTTLSILQRTTVPVLAIPRAADSTAPLSSSWPDERIVAALELDDSAEKDVDVAAHLAHWFDASLLLLHVVSEVARPHWLKGDLTAHDRIRVARAERRLETLAAEVPAQVRTDTRVTCGSIAGEIAALAASERAGLLVTPLHDRRGWFGARRGSISYQVLTQAMTPVLAYPPRWRPR